jgi:hypothetical protein
MYIYLMIYRFEVVNREGSYSWARSIVMIIIPKITITIIITIISIIMIIMMMISLTMIYTFEVGNREGSCSFQSNELI